MSGTETNDDDGLTVVLSPVQLAAVLQGATITTPETRSNRLWGALTLIGGGIELIGSAALLLTPEPTGLTKAGGAVVGAHGLDTAQAGMRQVWTGERTVTMTEAAVAAAARNMGLDATTAERAGVAIDIIVPLGVAGAVAAARALAIRAGRFSLMAEEVAGGHTIAKHVGRMEADLRARLAAEPRIPAATSFRTLAEAERVIGEALRGESVAVANWARSAATDDFYRFVHDAGRPIGYGAVRATGLVQQMSKLRVVLKKTQVDGRLYFVLTSFPIF